MDLLMRQIWKILALVDPSTRWTNQLGQAHLTSFIEQIILPKKLTSATVGPKYLKGEFSASQLAAELGVSKQMVLRNLKIHEAARVYLTPVATMLKDDTAER